MSSKKNLAVTEMMLLKKFKICEVEILGVGIWELTFWEVEFLGVDIWELTF